jgi:ribosomal protein S18 acetylase RimI-like enzyme
MAPVIHLAPMTPAEFDRYMETAVEGYAEVHRKTGVCTPEEALAFAKAEYAQLLPNGLASPNQNLFSIRNDQGDTVGLIWFEAREKRGLKSAYIYDFAVDAAHRGQGYGTAALSALEELVAPMGITRISLNVMGWNHAARALYERCGFTVTGIGMTKLIEG